MNFLEAVEQMKQEVIIKLDDILWKIYNDSFWMKKEDSVWYIYSPSPNQIARTDWEIFEEPEQTLYDFVCRSHKLDSGTIVLEYDRVKEALKEFIDSLYQSHECFEASWVNIKVKEIFGEEMLR